MFLGPVGSQGPPSLASRPDLLSKPPALLGTRCLGGQTPPRAPVPVICICRIETGKQYTDVCANVPSLSRLLPVLFIWNVRRFTTE